MLFVIVDICSRYMVGWIVVAAETGELAEAFIAESIDTQGVGHGQLTLHADRDSAMTLKPVSQLLVDLGVTRSHSRPSTSNDNPYSEAQFKTRRSVRNSRGTPVELGLSKSRIVGTNSKIRLLNHRGYGHHRADTFIPIIYLACAEH